MKSVGGKIRRVNKKCGAQKIRSVDSEKRGWKNTERQ